MIKGLINYFKLKKRVDEISSLRVTRDRFMQAKLTVTFGDSVFSDIYSLKTEMVEDEWNDFKSAVSKKINKMIEELENKPL